MFICLMKGQMGCEPGERFRFYSHKTLQNEVAHLDLAVFVVDVSYQGICSKHFPKLTF